MSIKINIYFDYLVIKCGYTDKFKIEKLEREDIIEVKNMPVQENFYILMIMDYVYVQKKNVIMRLKRFLTL